MSAHGLYPRINDRETHSFFEASAQGKLIFRACNSCGHGLHPPTEYCRHCNSWDTAWREASGTGRLYAWTTAVHPVHPGYPTPYTIVVVQLDDSPDVRLIGHIDGEPALTEGMKMEVWYETLEPGTVLPQWRPVKTPN
jgi:uncharacterized OB-fold protein